MAAVAPAGSPAPWRGAKDAGGGTPEEVAATAYQLCNRDFGYVTGTEVFVTGGQHLY